MAVFVLDKRKKLLMPCPEKRAGQLLECDRAVVHKMRQKSVKGFQTGGLVKATVPSSKKTGTYTGRVAIRKTGSFNIQLSDQIIQGISWKYCTLIQRSDGYSYHHASTH